jgi:hypothetical protein
MKLTCKDCGHTGIPATSKNGIHISAYCMECGGFIKHLPQEKIENDFILYFGKYKGRNVKSMVGNTKEEFDYLIWLRDNAKNLKESQVLILNSITK